MHIENVHIHLGGGPLAAAALAAVFGRDADAPEPAPGEALPKIGDRWPGVEGTFVGIARADGDTPEGSLVLLDSVPDKDMSWDEAVAWAQGLGDGARLPTRFESALIYANAQDKVDTTRWHWTGTQYSSSDAWGQYFSNGNTHTHYKKFEARARAVRRY